MRYNCSDTKTERIYRVHFRGNIFYLVEDTALLPIVIVYFLRKNPTQYSILALTPQSNSDLPTLLSISRIETINIPATHQFFANKAVIILKQNSFPTYMSTGDILVHITTLSLNVSS